MNRRRVVLAGGTGFMGRALSRHFIDNGYEVVVLTRQKRSDEDGLHYVRWDGRAIGDWVGQIDGAWGIINLTGRNVDCRYNKRNRRKIYDSRIDSVGVLERAIQLAKIPPKVWVQTATTAILGDAGEEICDETAPEGHGFSPGVARAWEEAFNWARVDPVRKVLFRVSFVLGRNGGALKRLKLLGRFFLGGAVGTGKQFYSWIHIDDLCRMYEWAIEHEEIAGLYNATGPGPVRNKIFMQALRRAIGRPWAPRAPTFLVKFGCFFLRTEPELALLGRRCIPKRFQEAGFTFKYPVIENALDDLI
ncbi:MAG: TIGR01777 family oxidoreductase [Verrucomicrobiota bacterium]